MCSVLVCALSEFLRILSQRNSIVCAGLAGYHGDGDRLQPVELPREEAERCPYVMRTHAPPRCYRMAPTHALLDNASLPDSPSSCPPSSLCARSPAASRGGLQVLGKGRVVKPVRRMAARAQYRCIRMMLVSVPCKQLCFDDVFFPQGRTWLRGGACSCSPQFLFTCSPAHFDDPAFSAPRTPCGAAVVQPRQPPWERTA